ncbi:agrobactine synthetase subunit F [Ochrobactrum sp. MR28]|nr:agrobactine synthetase subunit F [Ochrobactrum sp. MR28]MBX8818037.1 agrobactine synthetase subunit F [Ochrobactrum sp. MR31]
MEKDTSLSRINDGIDPFSGAADFSDEKRAAPVVSDYEQQIWLVQQQQPDRVLNRISAWRLADDADMVQLEVAVRRVAQSEPALNMRFQFNDDFELVKAPAYNAVPCVENIQLLSAQHVSELLLVRQAAPCDLQEQAPYQVLLTNAGGQKQIAFILHHILDENIDAGILLQKIAAVSRGEKPSLPVQTYKAVFVSAQSSDTVLPFLERSIKAGMISTAGQVFKSGASQAWQMVLHQDALRSEKLVFQDACQINGFIAEQFARLVSQIGAHERLALRLNHAGSLSNFVFARHDAAGHVAGQVREVLQKSGAAGNQQKDDRALPLIDLSLSGESDTAFQAGYPVVEKLLLPSREATADIALDISRKDDQQLLLTLRTGSKLLDMAGELLLDRLGAALQGEAKAVFASSAEQVETAQESGSYTGIILTEFHRALGDPDIQAGDDFFDCGGHSMLATRVIGRLLTEHGLEVQFNDFFKYSTAESLASRIVPVGSADDVAQDQTGAGHAEAVVPLSFAQMSMWRGYEVFDYGAVFNLPFALDFLDEVDEQIFARAFEDILVRHAGLRSHFYRSGDSVYQRVVPANDLDNYQWFWTSHESIGVGLHDETGYLFDLSRELPLRLRFMRDDETGRQILSFLFHHLALDEWSLNLMMDELGTAYQARLEGKEPHWEQPAPSMAAFARRQYEQGLDQTHIDYWKNMLTTATHGLKLPQIAEASDAGTTSGDVDWLDCAIDQETAEGLYSLARANNASLFNVIYAMIALSLHKIGNLSDLVIGTSADGRTDAHFYDTVGYFTTMVAHRVPFDADMTVAELIESCRDIVVGSMPYTDIPIDIIEESLGIVPGRDRFFEVYVQIHAQNKLNGALSDKRGGAIRYRQVDPDKDEAMLGMQFEIMEEYVGDKREIRLIVTYRGDRFNRAQVQNVCDTLSRILKTAVLSDMMNKQLTEIII